jgi:protein PhnA
VSLEIRSAGVCELCKSDVDLSVFDVEPSDGSEDTQVYICGTCREQIESGDLDENHFNCLNDSMWSEALPVQVLSYRLLKKLARADLYEMMYFDEDVKKWADAIGEDTEVKDSNGVVLKAGDSVVIIKDLEVKGAGFTAKRGTTVKNITIPKDVEGHIEGRVNGVKIYLKTEFLKKA